MNDKAFRSLWLGHERELRKHVRELVKHIQDGLEQLRAERKSEHRDPDLFRVRIVEDRAKEWDSLFRQMNLRRLTPAEAFVPGKIPDIVGARLVCHNLSDVELLRRKLEENKWPGLNYADLAKDWTKEGHPKSGYRAAHVHVKWAGRRGGAVRYGEIQVRTLLQDAWASFMHDDVYKKRSQLSPRLLSHLKHFSDLLHALDEMAQELRELAEPGSHARIGALYTFQFYAWLEVMALGLAAPAYTQIARRDVYTVEPPNGTFEFDIDGRLAAPDRFAFPISGDTTVEHCNELRVYRVTRAGRAVRLPGRAFARHRVRGAERIFVIVDREGRRMRHRYRVQCRWKGVFDNKLEYVFAPWAQMYPPGALMEDYTLELRFSKPPQEAPLVYEVTDEDEIEKIVKDHESGTRDSAQKLEVLGRRGRFHVYRYQKNVTGKSLVCLFSPTP